MLPVPRSGSTLQYTWVPSALMVAEAMIWLAGSMLVMCKGVALAR
jgi:hypothetical protein